MSKLAKIVKYTLLFYFIYFLLCFATPFNRLLLDRSTENQINYLSKILDEGYDDQLQSKYPEGKVFSNALLALSIIEYCDNNDKFNTEFSKIVDDCIERLQSKKTLINFQNSISLDYGMFYNGWVNYVLVSYSQSGLFHFSAIQKEVLATNQMIDCGLLAAQKDSIRLLDSYPASCWPADNMLGIVSIQDSVIKHLWLEKLFSESNHPKQLIHHEGRNKNIARGSSSAMITYFLEEISYPKAVQYNKKFKDIFVDQYLGIQLVKENENSSNEIDYDSGPFLCGYGAAATLMNIKTQSALGDNHSKITWAFFNSISCPINILKSKYYLFQQEPMFDLFMLWAAVEM